MDPISWKVLGDKTKTFCPDIQKLGGGNSNILVIFSPKLGEIIQLTNIFQMGWNHQLEKVAKNTEGKSKYIQVTKGKGVFLFLTFLVLNQPKYREMNIESPLYKHFQKR